MDDREIKILHHRGKVNDLSILQQNQAIRNAFGFIMQELNTLCFRLNIFEGCGELAGKARDFQNIDWGEIRVVSAGCKNTHVLPQCRSGQTGIGDRAAKPFSSGGNIFGDVADKQVFCHEGIWVGFIRV